MKMFRKGSWFWKAIVIFFAIALVAGSVLPYLALM